MSTHTASFNVMVPRPTAGIFAPLASTNCIKSHLSNWIATECFIARAWKEGFVREDRQMERLLVLFIPLQIVRKPHQEQRTPRGLAIVATRDHRIGHRAPEEVIEEPAGP